MGQKRQSASDGGTAEAVELVEERRSAEAWAEDAEHLPMWMQETTVAARLNPAYWKFSATKALMGWEDGKLMTRSEYEAAVSKQLDVRHG